MRAGVYNGTTLGDDDDEDSTAPGSGSEQQSPRDETPIPDGIGKDAPIANVAPAPPPSLPEDHCGRTIEGRYTLRTRLHGGAQGDVWIAEDRRVGGQVVLKWARAAHDTTHARVRLEITMLRMLRLPGVVKFIDDGIADGRPFIVTEHFEGQPFPGFQGIAKWETIADTTLALLETLSEVHAEGIVHRDLKPDNVLVDAHDRPGILDFGISHLRDPHASPSVPKGIVGTPLYLAPEQILGRAVDARTDLYALGIMLYEALTGIVPHAAADPAALYRLRLATPAPPILSVAPNAPTHVAHVVHRMLSVHPEERFASATDVLEALRGHEAASSTALIWPREIDRESGRVSMYELEKFFDVPERLLHLRSDAARILWERTAGDPDQVETELGRWVRLGIASRKGRRFAVDRASLDWLSGKTNDERNVRALFAADRIAEATRETIAIAEQRAIAGNLGAATQVLADGLRIVREHGATKEEGDLLTMWTKVALAERSPRSLDRALVECVRAKASHDDVRPLGVLLRASLAAWGAQSLVARDAVERLGPLHDPELERERHRIRIQAAAGRASAALIAKALVEIEAWRRRSGHALAELSLLEGQARQRYHEGQFEKAAKLHLRAVTLEPWTTARIETMLRSASASMEAFRHEDAEKTAAAARALAMQSRHAYWEGRAEWVLRSLAYRRGKTTGPDMELVDIVERIGADDLVALVCLGEAAAAMRVDARGVAIQLAERAATLWHGMQRMEAKMVARSLAIACGGQTEKAEVLALAKQARSCKATGIGIQVLGLLGRARPGMRSSSKHVIDALVRAIPRKHWRQRMDILSVEESLCDAM